MKSRCWNTGDRWWSGRQRKWRRWRPCRRGRDLHDGRGRSGKRGNERAAAETPWAQAVSPITAEAIREGSIERRLRRFNWFGRNPLIDDGLTILAPGRCVHLQRALVRSAAAGSAAAALTFGLAVLTANGARRRRARSKTGDDASRRSAYRVPSRSQCCSEPCRNCSVIRRGARRNAFQREAFDGRRQPRRGVSRSSRIATSSIWHRTLMNLSCAPRGLGQIRFGVVGVS